jgi:hypothetical protein
MVNKIMLLLGAWFAASVLIGMAMGRMMQVGGATSEPLGVMRRAMRVGSPLHHAPRRAA